MTTLHLVPMQAQLNDRVVYEDIANPRRIGTVVAVPTALTSDYTILWDDDGSCSTSDLRQRGWQFARTTDTYQVGQSVRAGSFSGQIVGYTIDGEYVVVNWHTGPPPTYAMFAPEQLQDGTDSDWFVVGS